MPGSANLDTTTLAGALVGVVDTIRGAIHGALATRPYEVAMVSRRWSGGRVGVGEAVITEVKIEPTPRWSASKSGREGPGGLEFDEKGTLDEVSLTYTREELVGAAGPDTERVFRIREFHGTRSHDHFFNLASDPDRRTGGDAGDRIDWTLDLVRCTDWSAHDGVDSP